MSSKVEKYPFVWVLLQRDLPCDEWVVAGVFSSEAAADDRGSQLDGEYQLAHRMVFDEKD